MSSYRIDHVQEDLRREITNILTVIKDPRISGQLLTIVSLVLTKDMSLARVYISSMNGASGAKKAVTALETAKGFIKRKISERLHLRKIPELEFYVDSSIEDTINMFKKIEK